MSTGDNIRTLRIKKNLSQEELGRLIGVQKAAINKYENGIVVNLKRATISKLAQALDTTPAYLMGWEDEENSLWRAAINVSDIEAAKRRVVMERVGGFVPEMVFKPLVGTIPCGNPVEAIQQSDEMVEVPKTMHCDFVLRCKGDSMIGARIHDGDLVYIRIQPDVESGEIAAVMNGEDEATLKRIRKGKGSITLWPENPNYEPIVYTGEDMAQLHIIGKAVGFTSVL